MGNIDKIIEEDWLPKSRLTSEQFEYVKTIKLKPQAIKYIKENTDLGLKESAFYYDMYINVNIAIFQYNELGFLNLIYDA